MKIKNQNGRTMIEMLGVVFIIGMVLVGALVGYSQAIRRQKVSQVMDDIAWMSAQIERGWTWVNNDNIEDVVEKPSDNPFSDAGYDIEITEDGYQISALGLDTDACQELAVDAGWADIGGEGLCNGTTLTVDF